MADQERPWKDGSDTTKAQDFLDAIKRDKVPYLKLEGGSNSFKSNYLRICPQHVNMDSYFTGMSVHFKVGATKRTVACRREMLDEFCPVCEKAFDLYNGGHQKEGKELMPSWRCYMNVVKLNQDGTLAEEKIYIWSVGAGLMGLIDEEFADKEVDLTHVETGYNFRVKRKGAEQNDTTYSVSTNGPCPFPDTAVLDDLYDCVTIVPMFDEEALENLLSGGSQNRALSAGDAAGRPALPAPEEVEPEAVEGEVVPAGGFADDDDDASEAAIEASAAAPEPATKSAPTEESESETMARLKKRVAKKTKKIVETEA